MNYFTPYWTNKRLLDSLFKSCRRLAWAEAISALAKAKFSNTPMGTADPQSRILPRRKPIQRAERNSLILMSCKGEDFFLSFRFGLKACVFGVLFQTAILPHPFSRLQLRCNCSDLRLASIHPYRSPSVSKSIRNVSR
jgi:hypothetical protein